MTKVPIRVYYHVTQINDFIEITDYIFTKIVESGLYDACEGIYLCVLGAESELPKLKKLLEKYPKSEIIDWNENKNLWEGFCVQHLKNDADALEPFYAWYLHSKSVTYPPSSDIGSRAYQDKASEIFWRDYMVHEIVTRWEYCYKALEIGYDICGSRMIPRRKSGSIFAHASGNMWVAKSEYLKTLPKIGSDDNVPAIGDKIYELRNEIDMLTKTEEYKMEGNIFLGEMWAWEQQPLTYIACSAFPDGFPSEEGTFEDYTSKNDLSPYRTNP